MEPLAFIDVLQDLCHHDSRLQEGLRISGGGVLIFWTFSLHLGSQLQRSCSWNLSCNLCSPDKPLDSRELFQVFQVNFWWASCSYPWRWLSGTDRVFSNQQKIFFHTSHTQGQKLNLPHHNCRRAFWIYRDREGWVCWAIFCGDDQGHPVHSRENISIF